MLPLTLKVFAIGCVAAGLMHVVFGLDADNMLGASIRMDVVNNASLDSQNRFYGACFTLFGFATWIASNNLTERRQLFLTIMAVFFFGGIARLISIAVHGAPSPAIIALLAFELLLPPLFVMWQNTSLRD
ncbi:MAG: DUF4345 domain-containing protein [Erythrobacter sp.]